MRARAHVIIQGRVQGVGFRYSTVRQAHQLDLNGWVRNMYDGSVEAVFEGEEQNVKRMLNWCEIGPTSADVTHVQTTWESPAEDDPGFRIRM